MRRSARNKMRKLEEIVVVTLMSERCAFCHRPLIVTPSASTIYPRFISRTCKKQMTLVTVHHSNENRRDNRRTNLELVHRRCHKSHHAKHLNG